MIDTRVHLSNLLDGIYDEISESVYLYVEECAFQCWKLPDSVDQDLLGCNLPYVPLNLNSPLSDQRILTCDPVIYR